MVKDATADHSDEEMRAALDVNILNYASAIATTLEIVDSISFLFPQAAIRHRCRRKQPDQINKEKEYRSWV